MALRWEMGMEFGMSTGMELESSVSAPAAAPTPTTTTSPPAYMYGLPSADTLLIDDLFDFSNLELFPSSSAAAPISDTHLISPTEPSSTAAAGTRSFTTGDAASCSHLSTTFADDLYIPCAEAAELEWLSQFVDDSFSDVPYPLSSAGHLLNPLADAGLRADPSSVARRGARKKRSKASAGAAAHHHNHTWSSLAPPPSSSTSSTSSSSSSDFPLQKPRAGSSNKKSGGGEEGGVRRCTHCASEKTPQWRTGPMGPKTLCNACGVRFKSGRLVSEYRPAASPTFVLTQHSNSHRKVMELRRQKEMFHHHDYNPSSAAVDAAAAPQPDQLFHDYEVC